MTRYIAHEDLQRQVWDSLTPEQRQEYEDSYSDAETAIELAELVYKMRTEAGLTQTELARRMGAAQPFVSAIERGARAPTVQTLNRIAKATGNRLRLVAEPA
jgi:ribosome-binding protein aMBF1 (putative translation factor)